LSARVPKGRILLPTIIYTLGKLHHAGAEIRSLQLIRAVKQRHPMLKIVVYVTSGERGPLDEMFESAGARVVRGRRGLSGLVDFWRACRRHGATLIHSNIGSTSGFFALAAFLAGVEKRICHIRVTSDERCGLLDRLKGRLGLSLIGVFGTRIVGVCDSVRQFGRLPRRKWLTLFNGVESEDPQIALRRRAKAAKDGPRNVIVLGRISPEKDYTRPVGILEALARRRDGGSTRLHFVGTGSAQDLDRLQACVRGSPVAGAISIHGVSNEPLDHLRKADVLLLTSFREGLPGVVLEALSVGTPVVASDLPGLREIAAAVEGVTLVPLGASDRIWSEAMAEALSRDRAEPIILSFRRGPFGFDAHVAGMASLWGLPRPEPGEFRAIRAPLSAPAAPFPLTPALADPHSISA
jgi:glycosyltransferase involved in cell wall biosynthesis